MGLFDNLRNRKNRQFYQQAIELGSRLASDGQYEEAIYSYTQAVTAAPDDLFSHHRLGELYIKLKRYDQALLAYQRALSLDPNDKLAVEGLAEVYIETGRYSEALDVCKRILGHKTHNAT